MRREASALWHFGFEVKPISGPRRVDGRRMRDYWLGQHCRLDALGSHEEITSYLANLDQPRSVLRARSEPGTRGTSATTAPRSLQRC